MAEEAELKELYEVRIGRLCARSAALTARRCKRTRSKRCAVRHAAHRPRFALLHTHKHIYTHTHIDNSYGFVAIYGSDFEERAPTADAAFELAVRLALAATRADQLPLRVTLCVALPPRYPRTPPRLALEAARNLSPAACDDLRAALERSAARLAGAEMVFDLVQELADTLRDRYQERHSLHAQMLAREAAARQDAGAAVPFA